MVMEQVSNWFINARVRLWLPMMEEMYSEEMKEHELNGFEEKSTKSGKDPATKTTSPQEKRTSSEIESKSFNSKQDVSKQS